MLTTLSFQRRQLLQGSLVLSFILVIVSVITSIQLMLMIMAPEETQDIQQSPQLQNLRQAVDIINEQTL